MFKLQKLVRPFYQIYLQLNLSSFFIASPTCVHAFLLTSETQDGPDETERFQKAAPLDFRDALAAASKLHERMVSRKAFPGERTTQDPRSNRLAQDSGAASLARERTAQDPRSDRLAQRREAASLARKGTAQNREEAARIATSAASFLQMDEGREEGRESARLAKQGNGGQAAQPRVAVLEATRDEVSEGTVIVTDDNGGEAGGRS